ncbi:GyrI-like domain-containing protein [Alkalimarinus alittae]|uniref:GyrI-like domain-containing protein n=1 Tax=Alkalimarinus alittae TaxID=2961619 RepID=A0ABY6N2P0_9ALTE|nr:GyrI-like domain-containing protein [Alkalimarinus alittae]UZE96380.1 GyrI-like domain-containing protein [Alkalimarinus alittae]
MYIFENVQSFDPQTLTAQIGWPVEKAIDGVDSYQYKEVKAFKSVNFTHEGPHSELPLIWQNLAAQAVAEGHTITGEGRTFIRLSRANGDVVAELQLGIQ